MKSPEKYDVFKLLKEKSAEWEMFAAHLRVSDNIRKETRESTINIELKLENVLGSWISSETTEVTWRKIIEVLEKDLQYKKIAKDVKEYLLTEEAIKKYSKQADFEVESH